MCGTSKFEIDGKEYEITFGWSGNDIVRDGFVLAEANTHDGTDYTEEPTARQELIDLGAENLADMILGWVKNGREI